MTAAFVLIHSPLVGPRMWSPVAEHLARAGLRVVVPALTDGDGSARSYWSQQVMAVGRVLAARPPHEPVVLVGHSGAGPLLPMIRHQMPHAVVAYLFVDAPLPHPGLSRLDEILRDAPAVGADLREQLAAGGRYPEWSDAELQELVPDDRLRQVLLADLHPRSLAFFTEPLPALPAWPDAPCGYIRFSAAYTQPAEHARRAGWPLQEFEVGHFHMLVEPATVARSIIALAATLCPLDP